MFDTTPTCAGSSWPDDPVVTHGEYESAFLLPQLMGAMAREHESIDRGDAPPSTLHTWLMRWITPQLKMASQWLCTPCRELK